jgi:hypothetical protein
LVFTSRNHPASFKHILDSEESKKVASFDHTYALFPLKFCSLDPSEMAPFPKIRVGLIGLNAPYTGTPTGTNWAASAHLPYLLASTKYELVALQNSSTARAAKSVEAYGLNPEKVKIYGNPEGE